MTVKLKLIFKIYSLSTFTVFWNKKRRKKNKTKSVSGLWKTKEPRKNVFKQIQERKQGFSKHIYSTKESKQCFQKMKSSILAERKNSYNFNKNTFFENLENERNIKMKSPRKKSVPKTKTPCHDPSRISFFLSQLSSFFIWRTKHCPCRFEKNVICWPSVVWYFRSCFCWQLF